MQAVDVPLVACARHKATSVADELAALDEVEERALAQAASNRDAAYAAVQARFDALESQIHEAIASKRAALRAELQAADAALDAAIAATQTLQQVRSGRGRRGYNAVHARSHAAASLARLPVYP